MRGIIHRMRAAAAGLAVSARAPGTPAEASDAPAGAVGDRPTGQTPVADSLLQTLSHLSDIAELQRMELARLLDQNRRLNSRIDQLLVLQHRDHAWRQRLAGTLQRLVGASPGQQPAANLNVHPDGDPDTVADVEARYTALRQSVGQLVGHLASNARHQPPIPSSARNAIGDTTAVPAPRRQ